ncbi:MAG: hypothetical protein IJT06_03730 [Selenomonadaceae bacterium]|nr:hypothetical protein [Selenomonadaceae bacterium]
MLKKISVLVVALLMLTFNQAAANDEEEIFSGDEKKFAEDFNDAAKDFKNVKLTDFEFIDNLDSGELYAADFEGRGDFNGVLLLKSKTQGILRMSAVTDDKDFAIKIFKAMLVTLDLPNAPFKEGLENVAMKTSTGKEIKVSIETSEEENQPKIYTISFQP